MPDAIRPWVVIWPHDDLTYPPKFKLWVCAEPERLFFLRISSRRYLDSCAMLAAIEHPFLDHDSWVGCGGDLIQLDEATLAQAMQRQTHPNRRGVLGEIHSSARSAILAGIAASELLSPFQKRVIRAALST